MLKELGLVVTGFAVGVGVTLYYTKDLIVAGVAHTLADVFEEEIEDAKDHKRDYTKPLRKSGKYPWGEHSNQRKDKAFSTTYEAFTILDAMTQHCKTYGQVTLADYYELIGQIPTNVDDDYGWTDLSGATIDKIESGGYTIHMPLAKKLNK
jgi:hypothetical protein